ncbi:MAG TPA: VanZ family protein [Thermoanaerobaculia bacterium]|nr:VanZ family protein [Thermoanaerobaculia bacterium]
MRAHRFQDWLPAVAWAGLILWLSGDGGSTGNTERWIDRVLDVNSTALFYINYSLRKGAHVVGYGILGALNLRAIRGGRPWRPAWAVAAVALAAVVAVIDETHQSTVAGRTAALADIGFDLCGAALAVMAPRASSGKQ